MPNCKIWLETPVVVTRKGHFLRAQSRKKRRSFGPQKLVKKPAVNPFRVLAPKPFVFSPRDLSVPGFSTLTLRACGPRKIMQNLRTPGGNPDIAQAQFFVDEVKVVVP